MRHFLSQSFNLPEPPLTEHTCPDQKGRVFMITGGYASIGFQLAQILYRKNATIYIAGRSSDKARAAIADIEGAATNTTGSLKFLELDLADTSTIRPAVSSFLASETRLDVLVNNAGVMFPPKGSTDKQGIDLQISTNCVGPFLLHKLLQPILAKTAAASPPASVRVLWAGSIGIDMLSHRPGGMSLDSSGRPTDIGVKGNYGQSKVGNLFFARHHARKTADTGVVHACFNPGNLKTELQRFSSTLEEMFMRPMLHPAIYGAYTELWAALSPALTLELSGAYVWPWGRFGLFREDIEAAIPAAKHDCPSVADKFVMWCEDVIKDM